MKPSINRPLRKHPSRRRGHDAAAWLPFNDRSLQPFQSKTLRGEKGAAHIPPIWLPQLPSSSTRRPLGLPCYRHFHMPFLRIFLARYRPSSSTTGTTSEPHSS